MRTPSIYGDEFWQEEKAMNRKELIAACRRVDVKNLKDELDERKLRMWCIEQATHVPGPLAERAEEIRKFVVRTK